MDGETGGKKDYFPVKIGCVEKFGFYVNCFVQVTQGGLWALRMRIYFL